MEFKKMVIYLKTFSRSRVIAEVFELEWWLQVDRQVFGGGFSDYSERQQEARVNSGSTLAHQIREVCGNWSLWGTLTVDLLFMTVLGS